MKKKIFKQLISLSLISWVAILPSFSNAQNVTVTTLPKAFSDEQQYDNDLITGISQNGSVLTASTGYSSNANVGQAQAVYNSSTGWTILSPNPALSQYYYGGATSLTADGTTLVGFGEGSSGNNYQSDVGYWTQGTAWNELPLPSAALYPDLNLGNNNSTPPLISGDGSTIIEAVETSSADSASFVYNIGSGNFTDVGYLNSSQNYTLAHAISYDGSVVAGESYGQLYYYGSPFTSAFIWTLSGGIQDLGVPSGINSSSLLYLCATCMSQDGSIIYGTFYDLDDNTVHTFKWTQTTGMVDLGSDFAATSCSSDGTIVVGFSNNDSRDKFWTASLGVQDLTSFCSTNGATTGTLEPFGGEEATNIPLISGDGSTIVCTSIDSNYQPTNVSINLGTSLAPSDMVAGLSLSPSSVYGGSGSTATVTLSAPAPTGGFTVNLAPTQANYVSTPSTVVVPAGLTTATFPITTLQSNVTYVSYIRAYTTTSVQQAALTVNAFAISSLSLSPSPVYGGLSSVGTVTLAAPAPSSGLNVNLLSQIPSAVGIPTSVNVPAGSTTATFPITTTLESTTYTCKVIASLLSSKMTSTLTVSANSIANLALNPSTVYATLGSIGTVTLAGPAPANGLTVNLSSSKPTYVGVPATVSVPAGATTVSFPITTTSYGATYTSQISAAIPGSKQASTLTVTAYTLTSLTLSPSSVFGGYGSTGTVNLIAPAPSGGITVNLTAVKSTLVGVPSTVLIPAGATSATFPISTSVYSTSYSSAIVGAIGSSKQQAVLTVSAYSIASLSLSPSTVQGTTGSTGTVTLNSPAPTGGLTVMLSSSNPGYVGVPTSVMIPAGSTSATFSITTTEHSTSYSSKITSTLNASKQQATLTVNP